MRRVYPGRMLVTEITTAQEWSRVCSTAFVPLDVRRADRNFHARLHQTTIAHDITVTSVESAASEVTRTENMVAHHPRDDVLLSIHRRGRGAVRQHGRQAPLVPGSAALYDAAVPYSLVFPEAIGETVVQFPRHAIPLTGRSFEEVTAQSLACSGSLYALAALVSTVDPDLALIPGSGDSANRLVDAGRPVDTEATADALTALVRVCVAQEACYKEPQVDADYLSLALRLHVDAHFRDPELTPEALAHEFHISVRYMQKLFARHDDSPASYILRKRLEYARGLMMQGESVSHAANASGFYDPDTFSRAFKRRYGCAPSKMRYEYQG